MKTSHAAYDIKTVAACYNRKGCQTTRSVIQLLNNHGFDSDEVIAATLESIIKGEAQFYKSMRLDKVPGIMADVYYSYCLDDVWYVKFYIDEDVIVLSCKPKDENW
ncbi:MAG: type II toxin-antitoxin system MqsR family toxin [Coriobacteriales bacterium]|nr:type II toxin-antitoxin system MqsR family toxin [Coriobacteriales bacterium]